MDIDVGFERIVCVDIAVDIEVGFAVGFVENSDKSWILLCVSATLRALCCGYCIFLYFSDYSKSSASTISTTLSTTKIQFPRQYPHFLDVDIAGVL